MTQYALVPHRSGEARSAVRGIAARVELQARTGVVFEYRLSGDLAQLAIPSRQPSQRADRLWEHTCFEAFIAPGAGSRYFELNFAPSTQWAAYELDSYRQGMRPLALGTAPAITVAAAADELCVTAALELPALPDARWPWRIGLTAVVEHRTGSRAYFALRHTQEHPDFHDAGSFMALLDGGAG
jgi:hypothetical protein